MADEIKKVIRDGKVAVLYSPGYGAGWFSWNSSCEQCLFSPEIVELLEQGEEVTEQYCDTLFGDTFYAGGAKSLRIEWLPVGTPFSIDEYDGFESVTTSSSLTITA